MPGFRSGCLVPASSLGEMLRPHLLQPAKARDAFGPGAASQETQLQLGSLFPTWPHVEMIISNNSSCPFFHSHLEAHRKTIKTPADWQVLPFRGVPRRTLSQEVTLWRDRLGGRHSPPVGKTVMSSNTFGFLFCLL